MWERRERDERCRHGAFERGYAESHQELPSLVVEMQGEVLLPNQRQEHCCDEGEGGKRSLVARGEKVSYQTVG